MRRSLLITLAILGAMVSLLGAGLFAALSDTAHTGVNEISTTQLPASSDLKIAAATISGGAVSCGTYVDDIDPMSPLISLTNQTPGFDTGSGFYLCLKNAGSQNVNLTAAPSDVSDIDLGCSGDEGLYDTTCLAGQAGELSVAVRESWYGMDCATGEIQQSPGDVPNMFQSFDAYTQVPASFGSLPPGQTRCFGTGIYLSPGSPFQRQASQTDRLTWRWAFTGTVPAP